MKTKQYKHVFENLFHLERNKYCSTFTTNIESSLIHPMIHVYLLASKYKLILRFSCIPNEDFYVFKMTNQGLFSTFKHNNILIKILANAALSTNSAINSCRYTLYEPVDLHGKGSTLS